MSTRYAYVYRFLLARLRLEYILKITEGFRSQTLLSLPVTATDAYQLIMDRITQNEGQGRIVLKALSWILHAKRALEVDELREAIWVEASPNYASIHNSIENVSGDNIIEACQGLVITRRSFTKVELRFSHQTVPEFLENTKFDMMTPIALAKTCLTYLSFHEFDNPCPDKESFETRIKKYKFSRYAAKYWATHARGEAKLEDETRIAIINTFRPVGKRESMEQIKRLQRYFIASAGKSLLHVLVENRLASICMTRLSAETCNPDMYIFCSLLI
jgi:CRISPR/Cas system endoribonuclease Cas6 (RAMP superfamily)